MVNCGTLTVDRHQKMSNIAIRAENISKQYQIGTVPELRHDTLRDRVVESLTRYWQNGHNRSNDTMIWALKDISFEVSPGEIIGVIGRNGAGKSTLLKILARITKATTGIVEIHGNIGSLLEVGTGFHPELTGRENVYLNGAILGMRKAEIQRQFDAIVDFAGIEKFIETPVKRYSSGMYVRLAFAVAAHLDTDILLVDEALAVGDASFQQKSMGKLNEASKSGRTILLVSHNMGLISRLATRVLCIENGKSHFFGDASGAISSYLQNDSNSSRQRLSQHTNRLPGMTTALLSARIIDGKGRDRHVFSTGDVWCLEVEYSCKDGVRLAGASFDILTTAGMLVGSWSTFMGSLPPHSIPSSGKIMFRLPELPLCPGDYSVNVALAIDQRYLYDKVANALTFSVERSDPRGTGYFLTRNHGVCAFNAIHEITAAVGSEIDAANGADSADRELGVGKL
jgi:lipopolysaccharide transport system ATP-binding protein